MPGLLDIGRPFGIGGEQLSPEESLVRAVRGIASLVEKNGIETVKEAISAYPIEERLRAHFSKEEALNLLDLSSTLFLKTIV